MTKPNTIEDSSKRAFGNPYASEQDTIRTSINIPKGDYSFVQQIRPGHGTMTAVTGTLWKSFCEELRKRDITSVAEIDEFADFVANATVVDRRELEQLKSDSAEVQKVKACKPVGKKKVTS